MSDLDLEQLYNQLDELGYRLMVASEYPEYVPKGNSNQLELVESISNILDYLKPKIAETNNSSSWYIKGDPNDRYYKKGSKVSFVEPYSEELDSYYNKDDE